MEGNPPPQMPMTPGEAVIIERLGHHKEQLDRIEAQATLTNGRVTKLEMWRATMTGSWRVLMWGGPLVSGCIVAAVARFLA